MIERSPDPAPSRAGRVRRPLWLFLGTLAVFLLSPARQVSDSAYVTLVSKSLLSRGTFHLNGYLDLPGLPTEGDVSWPHLPHQLEMVDGRLFYWFPPGGAVLSTPLVALLELAGISAVGPDGAYSPVGDWQIQKRVAPLLMALFVVMVYLIARLKLLPDSSTVVALAVAFGTQVWSTASRALWSHTWALLLIGVVVYELLAAADGDRRPRSVVLGTLLAWAYFCRPTSAIAAAAVAVYLLLWERRRLPAFAVTLGAWLGLFVGWSLALYGRPLPSYYSKPFLDFDPWTYVTALAGNLVSPSRGLLIFVPQVLVVGWLLVRYRASLPHRRLVMLAVGIAGAHWLAISAFGPWWGGHGYGPRLMTDLVPWLALLGVLALTATLDRRQSDPGAPRGRRVELWTAAVLVAWALYANGVGAISRSANRCWVELPVELAERPDRLWNWRDPQFLGWRRAECDG